MDDEKLQQQLDERKWRDSELKGRDTCGEFDFCVQCDKTAAFPCAKAYSAFNAQPPAEKKPAATKKPAAKRPAAKRA